MASEPAPSPGTLPPGARYDIPQPPPNPLSRQSSVDDGPFKEPEQAQNESISDLTTSSGRRSLPPPKGSTERGELSYSVSLMLCMCPVPIRCSG